MKHSSPTVLIVGGAGYVGTELTDLLLKNSFNVRVYDLFIYGREVLEEMAQTAPLELISGDVRDTDSLSQAMEGINAVIHLACISNDPSFDLNPELARSINYDCFPEFLNICYRSKVERLIYASSSSVYGIKSEPEVTEDLSLEPLTDYSKYKVLCENAICNFYSPGLTKLILRPATVCGYSRRLRLDLSVNILTLSALERGEIRVLGGTQKRPNIHIKDMCAIYLQSLLAAKNIVDGKIWNAGYENYTILELAKMVAENVEQNVEIKIEQSNDLRSYFVNSDRIRHELSFEPHFSIEDAIRDLAYAHKKRLIPEPESSRYHNIRRMKEINLT